MRALLCVFLLLLATVAEAEVYKCMAGGKTSYSDKPCDATAKPATLPPLSTVKGGTSDDLGRSYDERLKREGASRDESNAAFLKRHAESAARAKTIRAAIIEHRAVKGMTGSEVQSALGSPDETLPDGSWRYHREGRRITVRFDSDTVSSVSTITEKKNR